MDCLEDALFDGMLRFGQADKYIISSIFSLNLSITIQPSRYIHAETVNDNIRTN